MQFIHANEKKTKNFQVQKQSKIILIGCATETDKVCGKWSMHIIMP